MLGLLGVGLEVSRFSWFSRIILVIPQTNQSDHCTLVTHAAEVPNLYMVETVDSIKVGMGWDGRLGWGGVGLGWVWVCIHIYIGFCAVNRFVIRFWVVSWRVFWIRRWGGLGGRNWEWWCKWIRVGRNVRERGWLYSHGYMWRMFVWMDICMCGYICIHIYVGIFVHVYAFMCVDVCMYVHVDMNTWYMDMYVCLLMNVHVCMCLYRYKNENI